MPPEFEKLLNEVKLPSADLSVQLKLYVPIICGVLRRSAFVSVAWRSSCS